MKIDKGLICDLLGENIRTTRREKGLSQERLARKSQLDRSYLSNVENGKRNVTIVNIVVIASALDVDPWELLYNQRNIPRD